MHPLVLQVIINLDPATVMWLGSIVMMVLSRR
jgi:hypothetical protein